MECAQCSPRGSYLRGINAGNHGTATTSDRRLHRALGRQRLQSCPLMDRLSGIPAPRSLCWPGDPRQSADTAKLPGGATTGLMFDSSSGSGGHT